jgi:hypothetical protein
MGVSGQIHVPVALLPEKNPPVPIGLEAGWVSADLDDVTKTEHPTITLPGIELRSSSP